MQHLLVGNMDGGPHDVAFDEMRDHYRVPPPVVAPLSLTLSLCISLSLSLCGGCILTRQSYSKHSTHSLPARVNLQLIGMHSHSHSHSELQQWLWLLQQHMGH